MWSTATANATGAVNVQGARGAGEIDLYARTAPTPGPIAAIDRRQSTSLRPRVRYEHGGYCGSAEARAINVRYPELTMSPPANFGSPSFEPTDEQLQELSREAFSDVAIQWQLVHARLRAEIARLRGEASERIAKAIAGADGA
jgi:hypothetical protein